MNIKPTMLNTFKLLKEYTLTTTQYDILFWMINQMDDKNYTYIATSAKKDFIESRGITSQTFNNNISILTGKGVIKRINRGEYIVDEELASKPKGETFKSIQWQTEYNSNGKVEKVKIK